MLQIVDKGLVIIVILVGSYLVLSMASTFRRNRRAGKARVATEGLTWFTGESWAPPLSPKQRSFLIAVDSLLTQLDPPGASKTESFFGPGPTGALWITIATLQDKHESIQIEFDGVTFYGAWCDRHYQWEGCDPEVIARVADGDLAQAIAVALEWIESEMRRPMVLVPGLLLRKVLFSDAPEGTSNQRRRHRVIPAGFFDPPAP